MSPGYAPLGARRFTTEGLDEAMTLAAYGRIRLAQKLTSLGLMAHRGRVISILGGGKEGLFFETDPELLTNYSIVNLRGHFTSLMTLSFDSLSQQQPDVGFAHIYPGTVKTGLRSRVKVDSFLYALLLMLIGVWLRLVGISPEESGERMLWVALADDFAVGSHSLNADATISTSRFLAQYRKSPRVRDHVWEHMTTLFERATHGD